MRLFSLRFFSSSSASFSARSLASASSSSFCLRAASSAAAFSAAVRTTPLPAVSLGFLGALCCSAASGLSAELLKRSVPISSPAQFMSPLAKSPNTVFIVPSWLVILGSLELTVWETNLAMRTLSMWVCVLKTLSISGMLLPPPVRMIPPNSLSENSTGIWNHAFSTISSTRASTISMNFLLSTTLSLSIG